MKIFFFLHLSQVSLFDLTRLMLLEACEGGSRYKESTFCKLVTKDLSVFLSGVKNYAKGDQYVSVPQKKGVARTS